MTIDDFLENDLQINAKLIAQCLCRTTNFYWIRITKDSIPNEFKRYVDFSDDNGYDNLHTFPIIMNDLISKFKGEVHVYH